MNQVGRVLAAVVVVATCSGCDILSGYDDLEPRARGLAAEKHVWSQRFGNNRDQAEMHVAVDGLGQVAIAAGYAGTINFGGGTLASAGATDVFAAKLDADGNHLWSHRFGDGDEQFGQVAGIVPSNGAVVIAGHFKGKMDFFGETLESSDSFDLFVAKFASNGDLLWVKRFTGAEGSNELRAATIDDDGNVYVTGLFLGDLSFDADVEESTLQSDGDYDIFVAKLDPDGNHLWSDNFGDPEAQHGHDVAADHEGNLILVGHLQGATDFGGGLLSATGNDDVFVAKYGTDGEHLWSKVYGDDDEEGPNGVAIDSANNIYVTGSFKGTISFGGETLVSAFRNTDDIFVVKLDPTGDHVWSLRAGDQYSQFGNDVVIDRKDQVTIVGGFFGTVDFGGGVLDASGDDAFFARFDADGNHLLSARWGSPLETNALTVGVDDNGNAVVGGYFDGSVDFGGGPLTSQGFKDVFLVKLKP